MKQHFHRGGASHPTRNQYVLCREQYEKAMTPLTPQWKAMCQVFLPKLVHAPPQPQVLRELVQQGHRYINEDPRLRGGHEPDEWYVAFVLGPKLEAEVGFMPQARIRQARAIRRLGGLLHTHLRDAANIIRRDLTPQAVRVISVGNPNQHDPDTFIYAMNPIALPSELETWEMFQKEAKDMADPGEEFHLRYLSREAIELQRQSMQRLIDLPEQGR